MKSNPESDKLPAISGLILAGGEGRRMGGVDKGLQLLGTQALVQHVLTRIAPQVAEVIISANRHLERYAAFGHPVFTDAPIEASDNTEATCQGPLAGLLSGLVHARHPLLLCVPCDTPFLPDDLCQRLATAIGDAPLIVARSGDRPQPTVCLVRRQLLGSLRRFLARGERKLGLWQHEAGASYLDFADEAAFANLNRTEDLHAMALHSAENPGQLLH